MSNELIESPKKSIVKLPEDEVIKYIMKQALAANVVMPENYAAENAIKSAYLLFAEKGYIDSCKKTSQINAILDMLIQGLSPTKEQCYFIKYGNLVKCFRSYLGSIAVSKRFDKSIDQINYAVIYGGDKVEIEIRKGIRFVKNHVQDFANVRSDNILGAYAIALDKDGKDISCDIMTFDEIKSSWARSTKSGETQPIMANGELNPKSDHAKQPDRFSCRTVVSRLCKTLISVTDDSELLKAVRRTDEDLPEAEIIQEEIDQNANKKMLDFTPAEQQPEEVGNAIVTDKATDAQRRHIFDLAKKANTQEKIIENVGGFIGRKIGGLEELTRQEAQDFIDAAEAELNEDQGPDWA